jgi:hypothetical protein
MPSTEENGGWRRIECEKKERDRFERGEECPKFNENG